MSSYSKLETAMSEKHNKENAQLVGIIEQIEAKLRRSGFDVEAWLDHHVHHQLARTGHLFYKLGWAEVDEEWHIVVQYTESLVGDKDQNGRRVERYRDVEHTWPEALVDAPSFLYAEAARHLGALIERLTERVGELLADIEKAAGELVADIEKAKRLADSADIEKAKWLADREKRLAEKGKTPAPNKGGTVVAK